MLSLLSKQYSILKPMHTLYPHPVGANVATLSLVGCAPPRAASPIGNIDVYYYKYGSNKSVSCIITPIPPNSYRNKPSFSFFNVDSLTKSPVIELKCIFCTTEGRESTLFAPNALTNHFLKDHTDLGLEKKGFSHNLFTYRNVLIRVIFYHTDSCPIPGCSHSTPFLSPLRTNHLKTHGGDMEEFYAQLEEGHYFWWRLVPNRPGSIVTIPDMSPAFSNADLKEAALNRLRSTPNVLAVDVDDTAGEDPSEGIEDIDEDLLPLHVEDHGASTIPVAIDPYISEDHAAVMEDIQMSPGVIDQTLNDVEMASSTTRKIFDPYTRYTSLIRSTVPILPVIRGLDLPPPMATFGFGLLTLRGFPGDPIMPVCYRCGVIIFSHNVTSFRSHRCHLPQLESTTHDGNPEDEGATDMIMTMAEDAEDRYNVQDEEGEGDREEEMADQQPILPTRIRWAPLTNFLKNNREKFSITLPSQRPPNPIPAISVLPVQKGYACPVSTCPHAYFALDRLRRHINQSHANDHTVGDDGDFMPSGDCPVQSLRHVSANPAFFKVVVYQAEPSPASLSERMMKALTIADGRDKARTFNNAPLMAGPQHTHIFLKTFRYQSIFPPDVSEYTAFAISRVKHASPVYSPKREPQSQLVTLSFLVYMLEGRHALIHTDDTIRRHIGNKDLWVVSLFSHTKAHDFLDLTI
jgi:hypothetical protein